MAEHEGASKRALPETENDKRMIVFPSASVSKEGAAINVCGLFTADAQLDARRWIVLQLSALDDLPAYSQESQLSMSYQEIEANWPLLIGIMLVQLRTGPDSTAGTLWVCGSQNKFSSLHSDCHIITENFAPRRRK
eukprot:scaffold243053_cov40-Prasinocladus_malaysianus.AAC.2